MLTNDGVSFEQLGHGICLVFVFFTHLCLVDSFEHINWMRPFVNYWVSGLVYIYHVNFILSRIRKQISCFTQKVYTLIPRRILRPLI